MGCQHDAAEHTVICDFLFDPRNSIVGGADHPVPALHNRLRRKFRDRLPLIGFVKRRETDRREIARLAHDAFADIGPGFLARICQIEIADQMPLIAVRRLAMTVAGAFEVLPEFREHAIAGPVQPAGSPKFHIVPCCHIKTLGATGRRQGHR